MKRGAGELGRLLAQAQQMGVVDRALDEAGLRKLTVGELVDAFDAADAEANEAADAAAAVARRGY